jgi:hypothetical protein
MDSGPLIYKQELEESDEAEEREEPDSRLHDLLRNLDHKVKAKKFPVSNMAQLPRLFFYTLHILTLIKQILVLPGSLA